MLKLAAPVTPAYIPPARPIAFVAVGLVFDELTRICHPRFTLLDASYKPITPDTATLPPVTAAERATFAAALSASGQTLGEVVSAAAIPIVEAIYGLSGLTVVTAAPPTPAPTATISPAAAAWIAKHKPHSPGVKPAPTPAPTPAAKPPAA